MFKLLIHDLKQGFVHNGPRLLLTVAIGIIAVATGVIYIDRFDIFSKDDWEGGIFMDTSWIFDDNEN